jgi:hypothetical protein
VEFIRFIRPLSGRPKFRTFLVSWLEVWFFDLFELKGSSFFEFLEQDFRNLIEVVDARLYCPETSVPGQVKPTI